MPDRASILAAIRTSQRATARLSKLLSSEPLDYRALAECLDRGALLEQASGSLPGEKSMRVRDLVLRRDDARLLDMFLPAALSDELKPEPWLGRACQFNAPNSIKRLLEAGALPEDASQRIDLVVASIQAGCAQGVSALLEAGCDARAITHDQHYGPRCLLHHAIDAETTRVLVQSGCPLDFPDGRGIPPLGALISLLTYDSRRAQALEAIEVLLSAGCALSVVRQDGGCWQAIESLMWGEAPVAALMVKIARADMEAACQARPRSPASALALLEAGVPVETLSRRILWSQFCSSAFSRDRPALDRLLSSPVGGPSIGRVAWSEMGRWLEIGIRCPREEVDQLILRAEEAEEHEEIPSLSLLKNKALLARSEHLAQSRMLDANTAPAPIASRNLSRL